MHILQNDYLTASFKSVGAELCSVQDTKGTEYIWQADSKVWGRHAPVLFPIVGKLADNTYRIGTATYTLPQHGFARDRDFSVKEKTAARIVFELLSDQASLAVYPYRFRLLIAYSLAGASLTVAYTIENLDNDTLHATIGAHPGFACPLPGRGQRSDYRLVFEQAETASCHLLDGGNFNGTTRPVLENSNILPISDHLFDDDALVFKHLKSTGVTLQDGEGNSIVHMDFSGFPYLGIWSKDRTAPFVCIEPWLGLADTSGYSGDFSAKEGMLAIAPAEQSTCAYTMTFGEALR